VTNTVQPKEGEGGDVQNFEPDSGHSDNAEPVSRSADSLLKGAARNIAAKGVVHWLSALIVIVTGMWLGVFAENRPIGLPWRYALTQRIMEAAPFKAARENTNQTIVEVIDATVGRSPTTSPLSPSIIADLLDKCLQVRSKTCALDFDMSDPDSDHPGSWGTEFAAEVEKLWQVIRSVLEDSGQIVILPVTLNAQGTGIERSYLGNLTEMQLPPFVKLGIVNLPQDIQRFPRGVFDRKSGRFIDSLSSAIVRSKIANEANAFVTLPQTEVKPPIIMFRVPNSFPHITSEDLLNGDIAALRRQLAGRQVLIGGMWHVRNRNSGVIVDMYDSPVGPIPGVYVHANYEEAGISGLLYDPIAPWIALSIKFIYLTLVALVLPILEQLRTKAMILILIVISYLLIGYVCFINGGLALDVTIPICLILLHALFDHIWEYHQKPIGAMS